MNEKFKWVMSMLTLPGVLLLIVILYQWEYSTSGCIGFRGSVFVGDEALFVLAFLKFLLTIMSVYAIAAIYKRYTDAEFDKKYIENLQKNEAHVCLDCKEAFIPEGKYKCTHCGSSAIEPVKDIYNKYPNFESDQNVTASAKIPTYLKCKQLSKKERRFNRFLIGWSVLWVGGLVYKVIIDNEFIAVIIFVWPIFVIVYLIPYIIKIFKIK